MNKIKIKIAIVFISFCQGLQYTISPVLSQVHEHYPEVSRSMIQMLVTAPALLSLAVAVACGWLVTKISMKKLLLISSFIAGITGFMPFLYDSFELLLFARVLYGVGLGFATTLNTAVVAEHFEGKERVSAMGLQGASVGLGMLLSTTLGGFLGSYGFRNALYIHAIGFISLIILWKMLPDTGKRVVTKTEKIELNGRVIRLTVLGLLEMIFLIVFSTNIAMHLSGNLEGNSTVSGILIGVFSGIQIVVGLILGHITKYTKKHTLALAMLSFSLGCFVLLLAPSSMPLLIIGAAFCGMSQGIFVPQIMCEASEAVKPIATAMAAALLNVSFCAGQLISPYIFNNLSKVIFGAITTSHVYLMAAVGMLLVSCLVITSRLEIMRKRGGR